MKPAGFSPKARWDRNIPETTRYDTETPNQNIQVLAFFKGGKIYPKAFIWRQRKYRIKEITYNWQEKRGEATINYFSVSTGEGLYQIYFNNIGFGWRLDKIIDA